MTQDVVRATTGRPIPVLVFHGDGTMTLGPSTSPLETLAGV